MLLQPNGVRLEKQNLHTTAWQHGNAIATIFFVTSTKISYSFDTSNKMGNKNAPKKNKVTENK